MTVRRVTVIDSHTAGEPTRVVLGGGPDLGNGTMAQRLTCFRAEHDAFRSAVVNEPRGSDVMVGALLCEPGDSTCAAGVIFFNNVGFLGMCGHGTIGLVATLAHTKSIGPGLHRIDTPVGIVTATLHPDGRVSLVNVPSYRRAAAITVAVPGIGPVIGDVAWGGNWFFLVKQPGWDLVATSLDELTDKAWRIRQAVNAAGFPEVDHVELFGAAREPGAQACNFVLCPGKAYDRSPCGTGTCAKLACLATDGELAEGQLWLQESIIGSRFEGSYRWLSKAEGTILPTITGTAFVTAEATLLLNQNDPFCHGIRLAIPH